MAAPATSTGQEGFSWLNFVSTAARRGYFFLGGGRHQNLPQNTLQIKAKS